MEVVVLFLVLCLVFACFGVWTTSRRGHSAVEWLVVSFFGLLGLVFDLGLLAISWRRTRK